MLIYPADIINPILSLNEALEQTLSELDPPIGAPNIPDFYAGKEILITGGSGFIGKTLIEKLLRSCKKVKKIFIFLRSSKKYSIQERCEIILQSKLFDVLRKIDENFGQKVVPIEGDASKMAFGVSENDFEKIKNVSIVFNVAASVSFDEPLKSAVLTNTRGTRELLEMSLRFKKLSVFCHVSTAYINATKETDTVDEKLYHEISDWRKFIELCETFDEEQLNIVTEKLIDPFPNTYTFSKNLAEHVVNEYSNRIPVTIVRPSIVSPSIKEPIPGWVEGLIGPTSIVVLSMKGLLVSFNYDQNVRISMIPVDICVKSLIVAAWKQSLESFVGNMSIYNCTWDGKKKWKQSQINNIMNSIHPQHPLNEIFLVPRTYFTKCAFNHAIRVFFLQLVPSIFIDKFMKSKLKGISLMRIQRKFSYVSEIMSFFLNKEWNMKNKKFYELIRSIKPEDYSDFSYENDHLYDTISYFRNIMLGYRRFIVNDKDETMEKDIKKFRKIMMFDTFLKCFVVFCLIYYVYSKFIYKNFRVIYN